MLLCPKTGGQCWDDLCRGSGCLDMDGYEMLERCPKCFGTIDNEIPDCSTCTCDYDEYQDDEDES